MLHMIFEIQVEKEFVLTQDRYPTFRLYSNKFNHTACQKKKKIFPNMFPKAQDTVL